MAGILTSAINDVFKCTTIDRSSSPLGDGWFPSLLFVDDQVLIWAGSGDGGGNGGGGGSSSEFL